MRVRKSAVAIVLAVMPVAMNITPASAAKGVSISDPYKAFIPYAGTTVIEASMHEDYGDPKCWDGAPNTGQCTSLRFFLQTFPNGTTKPAQFAAGASPAQGDDSTAYVQAPCPNGQPTETTVWQTRFTQVSVVNANGVIFEEYDDRYSNTPALGHCPAVPPGILKP